MIQYLIDRCIANVVDQLERAKPRESVRGFHDQAQEGQRVFDMGGFGEPDPAELAKGNPVLSQLDLEIKRVRAGTKQHGNLAQRFACVEQLLDSLRNEARLCVLVAGADDYGQFSAFNVRKQSLRIAFLNIGDQCVGDIKDRLRAAEVLFEFDYLRL